MSQTEPLSDLTISELADQQLSAYNLADLDAFCACYHRDIVMLDAEGEISLRGLDAFRARYADLFARGAFGAEVPDRLVAGDHCVDLERYWRDDPDGGPQVKGELLVRYQLREGLIGLVQFLR